MIVRDTVADLKRSIAIRVKASRWGITLIAGRTRASVQNTESVAVVEDVVINGGQAISVGFIGCTPSGIAKRAIEEVTDRAFRAWILWGCAAVEHYIVDHADSLLVYCVINRALDAETG